MFLKKKMYGNPDFTIEESSVVCSKEIVFKYDRKRGSAYRIREKDSSITFLLNTVLYVMKSINDIKGDYTSMKFEDLVEYTVDLNINRYFPIWFSNLVESTNEITFTIDAGKPLFKDNVFEKDIKGGAGVVDTFLAGKLDYVKYNDLPITMMDVLKDNDIGDSFQSLGIEILFTELSRSKRDQTKNFRFTLDREEDFMSIPITEIPRNLSALSALASEDIISSLSSVIGNKGKKSQLTAIEQIALNKI